MGLKMAPTSQNLMTERMVQLLIGIENYGDQSGFQSKDQERVQF